MNVYEVTWMAPLKSRVEGHDIAAGGGITYILGPNGEKLFSAPTDHVFLIERVSVKEPAPPPEPVPVPA